MTGRKKIVILLPGIGIVQRGAENATIELAKRLSKSFDLVIFCRDYPKELLGYKNIIVKNIPVVSRDNRLTNFIYRNLPNKLKTILDIVNLSPVGIEMLTFSLFSLPVLFFIDCDLNFPISGFWGAFSCRVIRFFRKKPFIYVSHGGEEPLVARQKPDIYVALTRYTQNWLKRFDPSLKVVYIPNGVDTKKFSPVGRKAKMDLKKPIILAVAAFIKSKRLALVIRAVAKLPRGGLLILGDGPLKADLENLGQNLLGSARFKIRKVPYSQIPGYFRVADVFTLPSYADPSPLVYLEAAACGLPIVAPADPRRRQEMGEIALYCEVENSNDYARTLQKALQVNNNQKMIDWAKNHSWAKIANQYKTLFKKVL